MDDPVNDPVKAEADTAMRPDRAMKIDWPAIAPSAAVRPALAATAEGETVEARSGPVINRYRVELRHPDREATESEVTAETEAAARAQALADAPAGWTLHQVTLLTVESGINRYRIELRHADLDGTDGEVLAATEEDALAQAAALAPEGATVHRVVLMEVNYVAPTEPPPAGTSVTGMSWGMSTAAASGVASEPALFDDGAAQRR
jgi:hypothetical protein